MSVWFAESESELTSLRRQLAESRENLRLIQERKSQYVMVTDIPLHLVKDERQLLERIEELGRHIQGLEQRIQGSEETSEQAAWFATPVQASRQLKVFLCHASGDKPAVHDLYHRLRAAGFDPWLDEEKLLPGQKWELEIEKAVETSDAILICLSQKAVTEAGYVHKEIQDALDIAARQPEDAIFLIPLRLEHCEVPHRLHPWHWVDFFHDKGYERLLRALRARAKDLGLPTHSFEPEMILIPAGDFLMGSDPARNKDAEDNEQPQHTLHLPDYYIARTPITKAQYAAFVQATGYVTLAEKKGGWDPEAVEYVQGFDWRHPQGLRTSFEDRLDHPVVQVNWHDALAYCDWLAELTGKPCCLPSEAEWEKAARGTDGRIHPWGDEWDPQRCNNREAGPAGTTPVGAYPGGASPYDLLDMAGNVWEWTRSLCGESWDKPDFGYPYDRGDGREDLDAGNDVYRVLRGGAFGDGSGLVRCAFRFWNYPFFRRTDYGFRVCAVSQQDQIVSREHFWNPEPTGP